MRESRAKLAWLHRHGLRLLLAGLACSLTSQLGPGQGPIIINRRPAVLGQPIESQVMGTTVLEFDPARVAAPARAAIPSVLEFEPVPAPIVCVLEFAAPEFAAQRTGLPTMTDLFDPMVVMESAEPPRPVPAVTSPLAIAAPWPRSSLPVFATANVAPREHPFDPASARPAFAGVVGLDESFVKHNLVQATLLAPALRVSMPLAARFERPEVSEEPAPALDLPTVPPLRRN